MPVKVNPQQYADKLIRRVQAATQDMQDGVNRVQESPMAKAAASQQKWLAGINEAAQSGKWRRGLERVSLQDWKTAMIDKGIARVGPGVEAARGKITAFAQQLIPYENQLMEEIDRMPDLTIEHSIARMTAWARGMSNFQRND